MVLTNPMDNQFNDTSHASANNSTVEVNTDNILFYCRPETMQLVNIFMGQCKIKVPGMTFGCGYDTIGWMPERVHCTRYDSKCVTINYPNPTTGKLEYNKYDDITVEDLAMKLAK